MEAWQLIAESAGQDTSTQLWREGGQNAFEVRVLAFPQRASRLQLKREPLSAAQAEVLYRQQGTQRYAALDGHPLPSQETS